MTRIRWEWLAIVPRWLRNWCWVLGNGLQGLGGEFRVVVMVCRVGKYGTKCWVNGLRSWKWSNMVLGVGGFQLRHDFDSKLWWTCQNSCRNGSFYFWLSKYIIWVFAIASLSTVLVIFSPELAMNSPRKILCSATT